MAKVLLPAFPSTWESTQAALHAYALAVGAIPRVHAVAHPKWWHVSLKVRPDGLSTENMSLPGGGVFGIRIDLSNHEVVVATSSGDRWSVPMTEGISGTAMADTLIGIVADMGLDGEYNRGKFENDAATTYDPDAASTFFHAVAGVSQVLEAHRAKLGDRVSPVQLWPHGFDLSTEWFGTRVETYEEGGEISEHPSQINFGFYAGVEPYFYSNPWPFEAGALTSHELPAGAQWHTEGWEGSMVPYDLLEGLDDAADKLGAYGAEVYRLAAPTLEVSAGT